VSSHPANELGVVLDLTYHIQIRKIQGIPACICEGAVHLESAEVGGDGGGGIAQKKPPFRSARGASRFTKE